MNVPETPDPDICEVRMIGTVERKSADGIVLRMEDETEDVVPLAQAPVALQQAETGQRLKMYMKRVVSTWKLQSMMSAVVLPPQGEFSEEELRPFADSISSTKSLPEAEW